MEGILKAALLVFAAAGLLIANVWLVQTVFQAAGGSKLVIAPIRAVGLPAGMEDVLARMLLIRLESITASLKQSQLALERQTDQATESDGSPSVFGAPRTVHLDAQIFEPAKIEVKVAGVDVGGLLPRLQSWFVEDRTFNVTVSVQEKTARISGNGDVLNQKQPVPIWLEIDDAAPHVIVEALAYAMIQRVWARDEVEIGDLESDEFRILMRSVDKMEKINRRARVFHTPAQSGYADILKDIVPIANRITSWCKLNYLAAVVAEGAGENASALLYYTRLKNCLKPPIATAAIQEKIDFHRIAATGADAVSSEDYRSQVESAAAALNKIFALDLPAPKVVLLDKDYRNSYWDGTVVRVPPGIEDIPDVVAHEATWPWIQKLWQPRLTGQSGALAYSYADVLTSMVKQSQLRQTAQTADWTIAPGGIEWVTGHPKTGSNDRPPLRSMKAPGTAYDDKTLGKDPQVANIHDLPAAVRNTTEPHALSGIPNKAFYLAAMAIGTEKAGHIWVESLRRFKPADDFDDASKKIYDTAVQLHGKASPEAAAVRDAWKAVGL